MSLEYFTEYYQVIVLSVFVFMFVSLWSSFMDLVLKRLDLRKPRKTFKEKYVKDEYYTIFPTFDPHIGHEDFIVGSKHENPYCSNDVLCHNEENARLICTILNVDAHYKKFDVKAYLDGYDINKLKSLKEGKKE